MDLLIAPGGNDKMGKNVWMYNLPPVYTCTPTHWCLHGRDGKPACYAMRGRLTWPHAKSGAKRRYELSKQNDFIEKMVKTINKRGIEYFRLHVSGDFYSNDYVKKITEIAKSCPNTLFRTTTRRRDLTKTIRELNSLPNFIVRESLDDERTTSVMGLPFAALSHLEIVKKEESRSCKNIPNCDVCGHYCWKNRCNVSFDFRE